MVTTEPRAPNRNPLLDTLSASFAVFRECRPLALGIHKTVSERMPDVGSAQLRVAMRSHTASTRYLKALASGSERFDLDGNPAGEVTAEQREAAAAVLRERFRKLGERRRADEKAEQEAQKEREALQARQQKLEQLAARFKSR